jgi:salicylate 5-hydroxylase large subunit
MAGAGPTPDARASRTGSITDSEIFARERERIFEGPGWLYVCLEVEIPKPGDFKRSRLGAKEVVAVRDASGEVNVLVNRCAHRSAQFCSASRGTAKEFICPYHQWTYDLSGNLTGVPFRRGYRGQGGMPADFRAEEHGLQRLSVTRRHGVVFASFSSETEPLELYFGETMLGYFDRVFAGRRLEVLGYLRQWIPSNWKLMFENIKDPYHASLLHVFLVTFGLFRLTRNRRSRWIRPGATACWSAARASRRRMKQRGRWARSGRIMPCTIRAFWIRCANSRQTPLS